MTTAPKATERYRPLFLVAAAYDLILGIVFFFFFRPVYTLFGLPMLENNSYIHLTAGFVFVQGVGYWLVYRNMERNTDIVRLGVVYKGIYCLVAGYYFLIDQLPGAVFAWFGVFDLLFLVAFVRYLAVLK